MLLNIHFTVFVMSNVSARTFLLSSVMFPSHCTVALLGFVFPFLSDHLCFPQLSLSTLFPLAVPSVLGFSSQTLPLIILPFILVGVSSQQVPVSNHEFNARGESES